MRKPAADQKQALQDVLDGKRRGACPCGEGRQPVNRLDEIEQRFRGPFEGLNLYEDAQWLLARVRDLEAALRDIAAATESLDTAIHSRGQWAHLLARLVTVVNAAAPLLRAAPIEGGASDDESGHGAALAPAEER
jgi:hypothetical protein